MYLRVTHIRLIVHCGLNNSRDSVPVTKQLSDTLRRILVSERILIKPALAWARTRKRIGERPKSAQGSVSYA